MTPEQSRANVRTATAFLARQLGFYTNDGSGFEYGRLTPQQQITLTNALAGYITANPGKFSQETIWNAEQSRNSPIEPVEGITLAGFADAFIDQAGITLPDLGGKLYRAGLFFCFVYLLIKYLPGALQSVKK